MSCWATVTLATGIKASADEVEVALTAMGLTVTGKNENTVYTRNLATLVNTSDGWTVNNANFDKERFKREVARAKTLAQAKAQNYRVYKEDRTADGKIVIRMKVG